MPADISLTARQQEIWQFLISYVDDHGYPPTVREIGEEVGLASPSTVHAHLANLERVGLIKRDPTKPRAIELSGHRRVEAVAAAGDVPRLPLLGRVAAGGPLLAEQNVEDLKTLHDQSIGAAQQAKQAVERNANLLQQKIAERTKLLSQLEQAKMQEQVSASLTSRSPGAPKLVPPASAAATAPRTAGWSWPRIIGPQEPM